MRTYFFRIFLLVMIISCKKEKEYAVVLPSETNTGQNSMGFLYNGETVWASIEHGIFFLNDRPDDIPNATAILFHEPAGNKTLQLGGKLSMKNNKAEITSNSSIQITLQNYTLATGVLQFDTLRTSNWVLFQDIRSSKNYFNYPNNSFSLTINKIATIQKIVSGKFSGILYNKNGTTFILNDAMNIHQGRFDIKYINYY